MVSINNIEEHKVSNYILTIFCDYHAGWCWVQTSVKTTKAYDYFFLLAAEKSSGILITVTCMPRCFSTSRYLSLSTYEFRVLFFCQLHFVISQSRKLTSDMSPFILFISSLLSECLITPFLLIAPFFISKWPTTLFLLVSDGQKLVAFLV